MRDLSWGDARARALMHDICADAAARTGFSIGAIEVVRPQGVLEFVAITGEPGGARALLGTGSRLEDMLVAIEGGETHGAFTFVAEEAYPPGIEERLRPASWDTTAPSTDDPGAWQPLDMLVAQVHDDRGGLRALLYLDEPFGLRRRTSDEIASLNHTLALSLNAVLTLIEREEFAHLVGTIRAIRRLIRSGRSRHDVDHLLDDARSTLLGALSVDELEIHVFGEAGVSSAGLGLEMPERVRVDLASAAARAWAAQRVIIIEGGRVWGDPQLDAEHSGWFAAALADGGFEAVVVSPVGVDDVALGMLVCARRTGSRRWTDGEGLAALELGHDLGGAIANAQATRRERELLAELRELERARHWFLRELTHEINNPMTVIAANAELMASDGALGDADLRRARAVLRGTERLGDLLEGLAMLSRVSDPQRPPAMTRVDLVPVVEGMLASMGAVAHQAGVSLHREDDVRSAPVLGDRRQVASALTNLVDNAVKYSDAGGRVWVGLAPTDDGGVVFTCRDEGLGISEADRANLFTPLFRSTNEEALARPGTGLGLGIVREIMQRHGGSVQLDSELGTGTEIRLVFPALPD